MYYTVMNQTQFDGLPILPTIDTTNGGIRLNSNISMGVGAKVEFDGLKFREAVFATSWRFVVDSVDGENPRQYLGFPTSSSVNDVQYCSSSKTTTSIVMSPYAVTTTSASKLGSFFCEMGGAVKFARAISKSFRVKDSSGAIVYKWLDQVSDYKSNPPNATVVGTLVWGKAGIEANYLNASAFNSAVTAPTEPVTVIVMNASDAVGIPPVINGQPVTIKVWGQGSTDVLYGGISAYYAYRGRDPYLSFDGVDGRRVELSSDISLAIGDEFSFDVLDKGFSGSTLQFFADSKIATTPRALAPSNGSTLGQSQFAVPITLHFSIYGNPYSPSQTFGNTGNWITVKCKAVSPCLLGAFGSRGVTGINPVVYGIRGVSLPNGYSYIQQGDQSPSTVLPSHPSGADGTLVGATGWKYVGIDGHFSTNALLLNYINSTTLTAPLNIILLEPMDLTGIPSSKDGFAINIIRSYETGNKVFSRYKYQFKYQF